MSHSVKFVPIGWKDMDLVCKAFEDLGWKVAELPNNGWMRATKKGSYVGVTLVPGVTGITTQFDSDYRYELEAQLGKNFGLVTQAYNAHLVRQYAAKHHATFVTQKLSNNYLKVQVEIEV